MDCQQGEQLMRQSRSVGNGKQGFIPQNQTPRK
jgi:hypothetical protein